MSNRVVVLGSVNADLVIEVPRRPLGGETLVGSDLQLYPGGKGGNQAAAASRAGAETWLLGSTGSDSHGEFLRTQLGAAGVRLEHLVVTSRPTGSAIIFLTPDGENSIVLSPGANGAVSSVQVDDAKGVWQDADVAVLNCEVPLETVTYFATHAHEQGLRVIVNAAPATLLDPETLGVCDPLIVNEHEALAVLGVTSCDSFEQLAQQIMDAGARSVIITLGAEGAVIADAEGIDRIGAYRVDVVDTTGAGDAFVGAMASELAHGARVREAVRFATAMSALSVQTKGAQSSYSNRDLIQTFLDQHELI